MTRLCFASFGFGADRANGACVGATASPTSQLTASRSSSCDWLQTRSRHQSSLCLLLGGDPNPVRTPIDDDADMGSGEEEEWQTVAKDNEREVNASKSMDEEDEPEDVTGMTVAKALSYLTQGGTSRSCKHCASGVAADFDAKRANRKWYRQWQQGQLQRNLAGCASGLPGQKG